MIPREKGSSSCLCTEGPYYGTQKAGDPVRCQRCGDLAPEAASREMAAAVNLRELGS